MKRWLPILLLSLCAGTASAQTPTISPLTPVLTPGGATQTFTVLTNPGIGGAWSCANAANGGTCLGSINSSTGVYTPPASLAAPQSVGGYPLLPVDDAFNTDISGLAAASNSNTLIAGAGTVPVNFLPSFPINLTNASTPTQAMVFYVNSAHNGTFERPQWPIAGIEGGWFDALAGNGNFDHHIFTVNTTNGNIGETYQYYAQAPVTGCATAGSGSATLTITPTYTSSGFARLAAVGNSVLVAGFTGGDTWCNGTFVATAANTTTITVTLPHASASTSTTANVTANTSCSAGTCNSQDGITYAYSSYTLPVGTSADAAGLQILPLMLRSQEMVNAVQNGTAIKHALRMTLANGYICDSSTASACCVGTQCNGTGTRHIWPATAEAFSGGGIIPYGARFRLKSTYDCSGWSPGAQILCTTFKHYGLVLADGGYGWQINTDFDNLPAAEVSVLQEINGYNIATSNWEAVDESSLEEVSTSSATATGEVVTYTASTGSASTNVALMGTALNIPPNANQQYFMAGTPATQLVSYPSSNTTWSCTNCTGTIQLSATAWGNNFQSSGTTITTSTPTTKNSGPVTSTTGDFVDVTVYALITGNPSTVTDACGNNYTHAAAADMHLSGGAPFYVSRWYLIGITGCASNVWTATWGSGTEYMGISAREYSPNGATITLGSIPSPVIQTSTSVTSITTGTFNTSANAVVVASLIFGSGGYSIGAIDGVTIDQSIIREWRSVKHSNSS